ncbi:MAG TPA: YceI family protein [Gaiellaceae bacterium]|nr:YceI family protein [Gaiellaceae bacterium]
MSLTRWNVLDARDIEQTRWRIDPIRSRVEFQTPNVWGLSKVKGHFERYAGSLDLSAEPAIELTIETASLDTKNKWRDKHLVSPDFFDADNHPHVHFVSESATLRAGRLKVHGTLLASDRTVSLDIDGEMLQDDHGLIVDAAAEIDQRQLGMTWSPLGMVRTPSLLTVHARLVPDVRHPHRTSDMHLSGL